MQERSDSAQVLGNSPGVLGSRTQELSKCGTSPCRQADIPPREGGTGEDDGE